MLKKYHEITEKIKHEEDIIQTINQEIKQKYFDLYGTIESTKYSSSPLEKVCQFITDGTHQTPTYTTEGNGVKFLSSKDVTKEYIDWSNIEYIPFDLHEQLSKRVAPAKNDILLAKNGTIGIAALNDTNEVFDVYVSLAVLRPNELVTPEYLLCAINSEYTKKLFKDTSLVFINDNMRFIIASSLSSNVRTNIFPYTSPALLHLSTAEALVNTKE